MPSSQSAARINGEVQLHVDRQATSTRKSIYLVSSHETIRCTTSNAPYTAGTYRVVVYNEDPDTGDGLRDCDGLIDYGVRYLIVTGGNTNGVRFSLPFPGDGSGDFVARLTGASWSITDQTGSADPVVVPRNVTFTFPQGLYSTAEYHASWSARWVVHSSAYALPFPVDVDANLRYRNASGVLTTLHAFDGIGGSTSGSWSAQGGSNGTLLVTDELSNTTSTTGFSIPPSGGGGGGPDKCFPGGVNWPECQL